MTSRLQEIFEDPRLTEHIKAAKAIQFSEGYYPQVDILLAQINWGGRGGLYYIPLEVQREAFSVLGREGYIKLPPPGTNPRGVEITRNALVRLVLDRQTRSI